MIPNNLNNTVTLNNENVAVRVPTSMHSKGTHYFFNDNEKLYAIQVYDNGVAVVVAKDKGSSTVYSNVELQKIDETTVDVIC